MSLFSPLHKPVSKCDEPLGLPKGSVRSILTLLTITVYFSTVFISMLYDKAIPETLNMITVTIVAFYFGMRSTEKSNTIGKKE